MKYLMLLAMIWLLIACSRNKPAADDCINTATFEYFTQSKVDTVRNNTKLAFTRNPGDKLVFLYGHTYDCPLMADEEYFEQLIFEAPANATSFSYTNDELKNANTYFRMSCYCPDLGAHQVIQGTIKGQKISATVWRVEADVISPVPNKKISFNNTFTLP